MLEGLLDEFFQRGRGLVQPHAQGAVTLDLALDPHEYLAVHRLRTGVAAPQPPGDCGEEEQGQGRNHEQAREVDEVLRVEHQPEDVEAARVQVKQHSLPLTPFEPRQAIEDQLRQKDHGPSPACEHALDGPGIDLLGRSVEGDGVIVVILHRRRDDGNDFAGVRRGHGPASGLTWQRLRRACWTGPIHRLSAPGSGHPSACLPVLASGWSCRC